MAITTIPRPGFELAPVAGSSPSSAFPLGATPMGGGVSFSVYANKATALELLLFDSAESATPAQVIRLNRAHNRTAHYWHVYVPGLQPGQIYAYRADGPHAPEYGLRYDRDKVLLDPYGRAVAMPAPTAATRPAVRDNVASAMKSVVVDTSAYDWEGDRPLRRPFAKTIIYELHVGGFTRDPSAGVAPARRGTYAGLIDKLPYLQDPGITAVELLPVHPVVHRFVKQLIAARLSWVDSCSDDDTLVDLLQLAQLEYHDVHLGAADQSSSSHSLAISARLGNGKAQLYVIANAFWEPLDFGLPGPPTGLPGGWRCWIDTRLPSPEDICAWRDAPAVAEETYRVEPRSVVALVAVTDSTI